MSNIETIICLMLLFVAVPDACRKFGRPALVLPVFVIFGFILNPLVNENVGTMLEQAGEVGFLLLLFEVGLEIELPKFRDFIKPLRFALMWALVQYPLALGLGVLAGMGGMQSLVATAALTACSVGMAYPAWKSMPGINEDTKTFCLHVMVALEVMAIIILAMETTALAHGLSWMVLMRLVGIAVTIYLIGRFSSHLQKLFQAVLDRATHWRVHWLVLIVLLVCAAGARLGLDAPKTAFFLGLALSSAESGGVPLEQHMAPISHRFLIPVFFVSLGLQIKWHFLLSPIFLLAAGAAAVLLCSREILHRRWLKTDGGNRAFLLFCPNLTIVALAAKAMLEHGARPELTAWLLLTGLFMTVTSLFLLPAGPNGTASADTDGMAVPSSGEAKQINQPNDP
jgi:Kef-type K+ transport system membrane component KefB